MYSWEGGNQWEPLTQEGYEEACARCEHHVVIATPELRDRAAALLFYDKRTLGSRGRTLRKPVPDLGLHRIGPFPGVCSAADAAGACRRVETGVQQLSETPLLVQ